MKGLLQILIVGLLSTLLINCSSSPKTEDASSSDSSVTEDSTDYSSDADSVFGEDDSEVDNDSLENADVATDEYADDDYGSDDSPAQASVDTDLARQSASSGSFKGGFHRFSSKCQMKKRPSDSSSNAGTIRANKRLWVDPHNGNWRKVYKKSGPVYVSADCL